MSINEKKCTGIVLYTSFFCYLLFRSSSFDYCIKICEVNIVSNNTVAFVIKIPIIVYTLYFNIVICKVRTRICWNSIISCNNCILNIQRKKFVDLCSVIHAYASSKIISDIVLYIRVLICCGITCSKCCYNCAYTNKHNCKKYYKLFHNNK